ncbi:MAG TPA: O-antigen ligase family protein [Candidatus Saccharicenans sp.]|nr:O-antigen ligase family protein [Candidatus Saccharicenans sp.]
MFAQIDFFLLGLLGAGIFLLILARLEWGVLLLAVVTVTNVLWERLFPFEADTVIGAIVLIAFLANLAFRKKKWKRSALDVPVLILILAGLTSLAVQGFTASQYFNETATQLVSLATIMGMSLLIVQILDNPKAIQRILKVLTITALLTSLPTMVAMFLGVSSIQIGRLELTLFGRWGGVGARLGGIYEQPNVFATLPVLNLSIGIAFAMNSKSKVRRAFWIGVSIVCITSLLMSQSRSAILGALLGLFIMALIVRKRHMLFRYLGASVLMALVTFVVLEKGGILESVLERLSWYYYMSQQAAGTEPSRPEIWREAFILAVHNPFGYGAETKYLLGGAFGLAMKSGHNVFIDYLVSLGWLGFMGILVLVANPLHGLWKFIHNNDDREWQVLGAGLLAGLLGLWIHNLFHSMIHWMAIWIYFACVAATIQLGYNVPKKATPL